MKRSTFPLLLIAVHISIAEPRISNLNIRFGFESAQKPGDSRPTSPELDKATELQREADEMQKQGKYDAAIDLTERVVAIREKVQGPLNADVATSLTDLAALLYRTGNYDRAAVLFDRALKIRDRTLKSDDPLIAESLSDLASLYVVKGDLVTPEAMFQRAIAIQQKVLGADDLEVASTLNSLATLYENRGDRGRAEPLFQRALTIREKKLGERHQLVAISLNNLGRLYMANQDFVKAEGLYKRSLQIRENLLGANHPDLAVPLGNLATLYYEQGKFSEAQLLYERALLLQEKALGASHPVLTTNLRNLAEVYRHQGAFDRAEPLYQRALNVAEKSLGAQHSSTASALLGYALFEEAKGDSKAAVRMLNRSNDIKEQNLGLILAIGSEAQKLLYMTTLANETDLTISLHLRNSPKSMEAARLALTTILRRKGRVLDVMSSGIEALRHRADPEDLKLIDQLTSARAELATLMLNGPNRTTSPQQLSKAAELKNTIDHLEASVSARSSQFRAQSQPVTLPQVQEAIPEDGVLIEFVTYRPFDVAGNTVANSFGPVKYAAYVLSRREDPRWVTLGDAVRIDAMVTRFRKTLIDLSSREYRSAARALDEQVMRPVRQLLRGKRRLFLSPDGSLNLIPFAALVDEKNRYLVQNYTLTNLTSGRDLLRLRVKSQTNGRPVVFANPAFDGRIPGGVEETQSTNVENRALDFKKLKIKLLPGTAEEAKALAGLFPEAEVFTELRATEAAIKQLKAPNILHIATHGFFFSGEAQRVRGTRLLKMGGASPGDYSENPLLRSGLVLAGVATGRSGPGEDGILTALEVVGLDLWGTKLVVLSACDTGLGDVRNGEGVYGLRRALVLAGTETQIMSLWQVSDSATRDLMIAYYQRLRAGVGRAEALRETQLGMIKGTRQTSEEGGRIGIGVLPSKRRATDRRHPFYWASFIQSGEWHSMEVSATLRSSHVSVAAAKPE